MLPPYLQPVHHRTPDTLLSSNTLALVSPGILRCTNRRDNSMHPLSHSHSQGIPHPRTFTPLRARSTMRQCRMAIEDHTSDLLAKVRRFQGRPQYTQT